uniref:Retrotransposon protein, putative, unclassified n=1 Tax=Oryza sativa subsp. japonica TaxID=39947 RepID=Q2QRH6_ORYSJ|nr:retrotransposon protein, putative, unclassified [Oryza sativa Japonica Group]
MVEVLEEEVVTHTPTPSGSEDASGSHDPLHRRHNSPTPPRRSPRRREDPTRSGGSALSPPPGGGKPRHAGARRRLTYDDGGSPQGAPGSGGLFTASPVNSEPETPVQRWLDDVANLVTTTQQQLAAGGRPATTGTSRTPTALSLSARRRARRSALTSRRSTAPTSSRASGSRRRHDDVYGEQDARINIERRKDEHRAARMGEGASLSGVLRSSTAFVASLRNVRWPPKFRPNLTEKYDGSVNPSEFLQIYSTIIVAAGGDDRVRNTIPCIPAHAVVYAFRNGVRHNRMLEKIASKEPKTNAELFELADKVARKEEAWAWNSPGTGAAAAATPKPTSRSKRWDRRRKRKPAHSDDEVRHVPRRDNVLADELSRIALARAPLPPGAFEERLMQQSARLDPRGRPTSRPPPRRLANRRPRGPRGSTPTPLVKLPGWPASGCTSTITPFLRITRKRKTRMRFQAFTSELFGDYCDNMGIKLCFASPAHLKSNGQVECANAEILKGLKTKTYNVLKKHGDSWLEELPAVLWANRTTPSCATGETPFFLVYGAKAVLPSKLSLGSPCVALYNEANQDEFRRDDLDYLEE